ncbi:hypothetical protein [Pseudomonas aeruginosa]|uniref:hypothetical protein n=1 Tax=Pseudomonas aeruginosa TaxID=287 RepID=UPI0032B463C3
MAEYTLANGREVSSEVLLKLNEDALRDLPLACKTCQAGMWQTMGSPGKPEAVAIRCYCRVMHQFTWDSRNREEILDCDQLYGEAEEDEAADLEDEGLPPFLRTQREREAAEAAGLMSSADSTSTTDDSSFDFPLE